MNIAAELKKIPTDGEEATQITDTLSGLLMKSATDSDYRQLLLKNGRLAIEQYIGGPLPEDLSVRFVEKRGDATIVLPPFMAAEELSEDELVAVAGGATPAGFFIALSVIELVGAAATLAVAIKHALDGR
ncbi:MAG: class IIb bacteriocin, lactobin A/cerein 7B family [Gammaproteobacteria bacterium]|nr:class IIb bacteriocin, lactobin A/cerein 7B family [Gammaproteobacteria bacterium]